MIQLSPYDEKILSRLRPEDKDHCLKMFEYYRSHIDFINDQLETLKYYLENMETDTANCFEEEWKKSEELKTALSNIKLALNLGLVLQIEKHFADHYRIQVESYTAHKGVIKELATITPIIESMLRQAGDDLWLAGRQQIITNFQEWFIYPEEQPTLHGELISLPNYFTHTAFRSRGKIYLDRDIAVGRLLDAICLYFTNTNARPKEVKDIYEQWQYEIDIRKTYIVLPHAALKFFRNGKINIYFATRENAKQFWDFFELTGIAARNAAKNK